MATVGTAYVRIQPSMQGFSSSVTSAMTGQIGNIGNSASKAFADKFQSSGSSKMSAVMGGIAGVAASVANKAFATIGNSIGAAVSRVDQLNNFPKVMQNLGYSSDDAARSIQKMSSATDGLPTSLDTLSGMTQQLAPLCSNLDEATDISIALNNAMLAGGKSSADVSRAMTQYTQALSKGKPDLMDWRTLQEVMPGQLNQIAQSMLGAGKNSNDLYNELKNGTVSMQDFNQAVLKLNSEGLDGFASFEQQARDATQGIGTAISNVGTRIAKALGTLMNAFGATRISGAINGFSSSFGTLANKLVPLFTKLGEGFSAMCDFISNHAEGLKTAIGALSAAWVAYHATIMAQNIGSTIAQNMTKAIQAVVRFHATVSTATAVSGAKMKGLAQITNAVGVAFEKVQKKMSLKVGIAGIALAGVAIAGFLTKTQTGQTIMSGFKTAASNAFNGLKSGAAAASSAFSAAIGATGNFANSVAAKLGEIGSKVGSVLGSIGATIGTALGNAFNAIKPVFATIGQALSSAFSAMQPIFSTWANNFGNTFSILGQTLAASFSAMSPYISQLGTAFQTAFAAITPALMQVMSAFATMRDSIMAQIPTLIAQLMPSIMQLVQTASQLIPLFIQLGATIMTSLANVIAQILPMLAQLISAILPVVVNFISQLLPLALQLVQMILPVILQCIQAILPTLLQLVQAVLPIIVNLINMLLPPILQIIQMVLPVITSLLQVLMPIITQLVTTILPIVVSVIQLVANILTALMPVITAIVNIVATYVVTAIKQCIEFINAVLTVLSCVIEFLTGVFSGNWEQAWNAIGKIGETIWNFIKSTIENWINVIKSVIDNVLGVIKGIWDAAWNGISSFLSGIWNGMSNAVSNAINGIVDFFKNLPNNILNALGNMGELLVNAGKSIIDGLLSGIKGAIDGVYNFVSGIGEKIASLKGPEQYDLKLLIPNGKWIMQSLSTGLQRGMGCVEDTLKDITNSVQSFSFAGAMDNAIETAKQGAQTISDMLMGNVYDAQVQAVGFGAVSARTPIYSASSSSNARPIVVNVNNAEVNSRPEMEKAAYNLLMELRRLGYMQGGAK